MNWKNLVSGKISIGLSVIVFIGVVMIGGLVMNSKLKVEKVEAVVPTPVQIFYSSFEPESWGDGWYCSGNYCAKWINDSVDAACDSKSAIIQQTDSNIAKNSLTKFVSTVGYNSIVLSYKYKIAETLEWDYVYVEWTNNGSNWTTIKTYTNLSAGAWISDTIAFPLGANNNQNFGFRFRGAEFGEPGNDKDEFRLDCVELTGVPMCTPQTYYRDSDGDGYGNPKVSTQQCPPAPPGYVSDNTDCDDKEASIHPNASEICGDGIDQDCNGSDLQCPLIIVAHKIVCQSESDLPNWGNNGPDITANTVSSYLSQHPNCHLVSDWYFEWAYGTANTPPNPGDNIIGPAGGNWHTFGPTDNNGKASITINSLSGDRIWVREVMKEGYLPFSGDLNYPYNDVSAELYCHTDVKNYDNYDYIIRPQMGQTYYCVAFNVSEEEPEPYCGDGSVNQRSEQCDDGNNVSGDGCSATCQTEPLLTWYLDSDNDTYGDPTNSTTSYNQPEGYVLDNNDCNDGNSDIHPAAPEFCNGIDDNCDGVNDEGCELPSTWYRDADEDGHGDPQNSTSSISQPEGYVENGDDCDDSNSAIYPGATEICNDVDDDCDGAVDEDGVCGQEQPQQPTGGGGTGSFTYFTVYAKVLGGVGKVTSQPSGIDCGSVCQENFNINSTVVLTATPAEGFSFDHWEGDCQGTETTCTLTMDATKSVRAVFSGQVLGEATEAPSCGIYLREYIKYGAPNNPEEVKKLQAFLNSYMGANLEVTGVYDLITMDWVNKFQLKCKEEVLRPWVEAGVHPSEDVPTGYVYKTTQRWINMLMCPVLNLPMPDLSEDVARLKAVGTKEITGEVAGEATEAEEEMPATQEEMPPTGEETPPVEVEELEVETKEGTPPAPTTPSPQGGMSGGLIALGALVVLAGVGLWYGMKGKKKK